jgi:AraC-like DNA-binding protein
MSDISMAGIRQASVLFYQILLKAYRQDEARTTHPSSIGRRAVNLINTYLTDYNFNVADLAQRLDMHRSRLSRLFRDEIGISPSAYITQRRLQKAMSALRETTLTVAEIARACGFPHPDYFCRLFRKQFDLTPSEFRAGVQN